MQKALKTVNSEKCVFSCQTSKLVPEAPSSLVFRQKPAPGATIWSSIPFKTEAGRTSKLRRAPKSVFCPEKPANSSPLNSSPLVTASSPLAFWAQKCAKAAPVPELLLRRVFRGPTARDGTEVALEFFRQWNFKVDLDKSWAWTTVSTKCLEIKSNFAYCNAKQNLGSYARYKRCNKLGTLTTRVSEGIARSWP